MQSVGTSCTRTATHLVPLQELHNPSQQAPPQLVLRRLCDLGRFTQHPRSPHCSNFLLWVTVNCGQGCNHHLGRGALSKVCWEAWVGLERGVRYQSCTVLSTQCHAMQRNATQCNAISKCQACSVRHAM